MNKKWLRFIRVKPAELKIVSLAFLFAFCIGAVQSILFSIPLASFLSRFSSSFLPHIYIGSGIAIFCFGIAFSYLEKKASVFYVLAIPIVFFSASLFAFWIVLETVKTPIIFILLLIWAFLIGSLIISITMLLINQLFTFQQSKRIYGLLFGGLATGGAIVGFGMNILINLLGSNHLILLAAVMLCVAFLLQFPIRKHSGGRLQTSEELEEARTTKATWKSFKNKKYILQVFLLTFLIYFIYYSFDLLLNTTVQKHFPDERDMAVFFGGLFAVYDIVALFAGFVLSTWLLSRFGLIASLVFWPLGMAIMLSLVFLFTTIPNFAALVFGMILVSAVFDVTIREAITEQSILLLFQPLRPVPRAWAQLKNEAIIIPIAMSLIGTILLLVDRYLRINIGIMSLLIIAFSACALAMILFVLRKGYLQLLVESLSKKVIASPEFKRLNKDSLNVLKSHLQSAYPEETIYVLKAIENIDQNEFVKQLSQSLESPLDEVRCFALSKIEKYRIKSFSDRLIQLCLSEKNPAVLGPALLALAATTDLKKFPQFKEHVSNKDCIISLIKYGHAEEKNEASLLLKQKVVSPNEEDRILAAKVLQEVAIAEKADLLLTLLKDASLDVRDDAAKAAVKIKDERLYHALIENLEIPHVHDSALQALSQTGKPLFDYIATHFESYSPHLQASLATLIGYIKDSRVIHFLEKLLSTAKRRLLYPTLLSLKRHSYKSTNEELIQQLLEAENENILFLKEIVLQSHFEEMKILHSFLCREIELSQECCFLLLSFIYPEELIMQAKMGLSLKDEEMNSNAVELLLQTLDSKDQKLLALQLTFQPSKEEMESAPSEEEIKELLLKVKDYTANCFIPALAAAVIYEIGLLKVKSLVDVVIKQELKDDALMQEIQPISIKRLEA